MIPKTLHKMIERQKISVLHEIRNFVDELISERGRPLEPSEIPERGDREVVSVKTVGKITYRFEKVYCGKNCGGCPHGPYWYGYWKEEGKTKTKYVGKELR